MTEHDKYMISDSPAGRTFVRTTAADRKYVASLAVIFMNGHIPYYKAEDEIFYYGNGPFTGSALYDHFINCLAILENRHD